MEIIGNLIVLYFIFGLALSLYDLYHSQEALRGESFWIVVIAQVFLIICWPFWLVKPRG